MNVDQVHSSKTPTPTVRCARPHIEAIRKPCGCASTLTCLSCGRVDRFAEDYHRETCRLHKWHTTHG